MPTFANPLAIDPASFGTFPPAGNATGGAVVPVILYAGNLYQVLAPNAATGNFEVWKSTDSGINWISLDSANAPTFPAGQAAFDGTSQIAVIFYDLTGAGVQSFLQIFDLATETWGAVIAGGPIGPLGGRGVIALGMRSDGSIIFIYQNPGVGHAYLYGSYNGAWNYPIGNLDQNFAGGLGLSAMNQPIGVVDSSDIFHVVWGGIEGVQSYGYYQAIDSLDALGAFKRFPNTDTESFPLKTNIIGRPVVLGSNLFIPFTFAGNPADSTTFFAGGYIGTPVAAPVWTQVSPIDPGFPADSTRNPNFPPVATSDGTTVSVLFICQTSDSVYPSGRIVLLESTDLITWTATTIFDVENDLGFLVGGVQTITDPILTASAGVTIAAKDPTNTYTLRFFLPVNTIGGPNARLDAVSFPVISFPRLQYLDSAGAKRDCFPLRKRGC